jgi:DNA-binding response OmpR family regulator
MGMLFLDIEGQPFAEQIAAFIQKETGGEPERESVPPAIDRSTILVVDDVASQRNAAAAALERAGHEVLTADSGVSALGQALKHEPDLILSDVEMPALDGWQLVRLLRARPSLADKPIIFLTSLSSDQERLRGYRLGVDDYIAKPFVEAELVARIERVLGHAKDHPHSVQGNKALRGALEHVSLASLLSFLDLERRTGRLLLVHDEGMATIWLRDGRVLRVSVSGRLDRAEPIERLMHILDWGQGRFELADDDGVADQDEIGLPTSQLLLEHARRRDEEEAVTTEE